MQLRSIQVLRGIAASMVVLFHLTEGAFVTGAGGVDIFFVISGFIMGTVGTRDRPLNFLRKRIVRIIPLYWGVTLLMCAAAIAGLFRNFSFDAASLAKSLLFIPYFNGTGEAWPLLVVGWTLNFEMFFYVIFAIGLLLARPILLSTIVMAILVLAGVVLQPSGAPLQTWTSPLLLEFTAGLLLAHMVWFRERGVGLGMVLLGLAGFVAAAILGFYEGAERIVGWGVPAFLLVAGCVSLERAGSWPGRLLRPLESVGDASYSLYLWHGLVIAIGHRLLGSSVPVNILLVIASLVVAVLSFRVIEQPVGRWLNGVTAGRRPQQSGQA